MNTATHSVSMADDRHAVIMELARDGVSLAVTLDGPDLDLLIAALTEMRAAIVAEARAK